LSQNIIELVDLTKKYGFQTAVDHLNLTVRRGEIFGLLGPNGAGKSTTILMMLGLTEPSSGSVRVCGIDSTRHPIEVKRKVGYLPDDVGFYEDRTGLENIMYTAMLNRLSRQEARRRAEELLVKVGLANAAEKKAGKYSRGMRQRLGLADVLIKQPEVIILDEPTLGIDPEGVREFLSLIHRLSRKEGITVLLSSHHLHQVQQICDRVGLFVSGRLLAEGDIATLSRRLFSDEPYVIEAGISFDGNAQEGAVKAERPDRTDRVEEAAGNGAILTGREALLQRLKSLKGVSHVEIDGENWQIRCSRDAARDIARTIIEAGAGLNYLFKKEYGLDEIYHRYFEGGEERGASNEKLPQLH
jgi:ABC-2 type transport system ATP-binding protein